MAQDKVTPVKVNHTIQSLNKRLTLVEEENIKLANALLKVKDKLSGLDKLTDLVAQLIENAKNTSEDKMPEMLERIEVIEDRLGAKAETIQRVATYNEETAPEQPSATAMSYDDQVRSVINATRCLPPNYVVDGRHTLENVSAICGFKVTQDQLDLAYKDEITPG